MSETNTNNEYGYWFCKNCEEELSSCRVTYQELCDSCGHPAEWVRGESVHIVEHLSAQITRLESELANEKLLTATAYETGFSAAKEKYESELADAREALRVADDWLKKCLQYGDLPIDMHCGVDAFLTARARLATGYGKDGE